MDWFYRLALVLFVDMTFNSSFSKINIRILITFLTEATLVL